MSDTSTSSSRVVTVHGAVGTLRARSRYVAAESADAVRTTSEAVAQGLGIKEDPKP